MSVGPFGSGSFGTGIFSNTPFYSTATLIDAVLRDTGHATPSAETIKRTVALDFLNNRYAAITTLQHWTWLSQELDTLLDAPYTDGTIAATSGSQTILGTGTLWSANVVPNNVLAIPSLTESYLISDIESQTEITLEGEYAGDTSSSLSYSIIKPIYSLPADVEHVHSIQVDGVGELVPVGRQEFVRIKQFDTCLTGPPRIFTELTQRSDGVMLIEVYPAPDKNYTARLHYGVNIMRLFDSGTNYPLVPDRHRYVLYLGALADMYSYLRDATMSERYEALFQAALLNMRNDTQITDSRIQFQQSRNYKQRRRRGRFGYSYSIEDFARLP